MVTQILDDKSDFSPDSSKSNESVPVCRHAVVDVGYPTKLRNDTDTGDSPVGRNSGITGCLELSPETVDRIALLADVGLSKPLRYVPDLHEDPPKPVPPEPRPAAAGPPAQRRKPPRKYEQMVAL
ncbi:hypothetical protein [Yinghuangia sp. YIM S09857]|uniref:hypothetical protein n=1 Tax=Yinghuangia sp. YIM S09857 TaxID=3436929 RepID=UPI003F534C88